MWLVAILSSIVCGFAFYGLLGLVGIVPGMLIGFLIAGRIEDSRRLRGIEKELEGLRRAMAEGVPAPSQVMPEEAVQAVPAEPVRTAVPSPQPSPLSTAPPRSVPAAAQPVQATAPAQSASPPAEPARAAGDSTAPPPAPPGKPESFTDAIGRFFTGGNLAVTAGVVILFIGMSFLVKYAAEHGWFPVELRLSLAGLAGIMLLVIGWRLAGSRRVYGLVLQGGGIGIMYLTTFAALRLYGLIPAWSAFIMLVVLCVSSAILAVRQDASELAFMAAVGGFLAPVIASTGSGNHVFLFSYYAIINAGIASVAWFRAWRKLNLLGFFFTYGIGMSWGFRYYTPGHFPSVEPFLVVYFLIFVFIAVAFANRYGETGGVPPVEGTLVFGTPVVTFFLQSLMVTRFEYGLAISAFILGAFYITSATALYTFRPERMRGIAEAFLAFGAVFATLSVPLAVDGRWTAAIWALEGAGIYWAGVRQGKLSARVFGLIVQISAGFAFIEGTGHGIYGTAVLNSYYLGTLIISISGMLTAYFTHFRTLKLHSGERYVGNVMLWWGLIWWLVGGLHEIFEHLGYRTQAGGAVIFIGLSFLVLALVHSRLAWVALRPPSVSVVPLMWIFMFFGVFSGGHPFGGIGYIAWPVSIAAMYYTLYLVSGMREGVLGVFHAFALWLVGYMLAAELSYQAGLVTHWRSDWGDAALGFVPAMLMLAIVGKRDALRWPLGALPSAYGRVAPGGLMLWMVTWILSVNLSHAGNAWPLAYVPLLNPTDVVSGVALFAMLSWRLDGSYTGDLRPMPSGKPVFYWVWGPAGLLWLSASLLRAIHHIADIPYRYNTMMQSVLVQASLSIFWSVVSLVMMVFANRRGMRPLWISGASLMGVVVVKLFIIDLSGVGTVSRIVSFVAVGVLLLIIGYFTPLPPKRKEA